MDLDAEIGKCSKKLDVARMNADKIRKIVSVPDYETTIPENVREVNAEKVRCPFFFHTYVDDTVHS